MNITWWTPESCTHEAQNVCKDCDKGGTIANRYGKPFRLKTYGPGGNVKEVPPK